MKKIFVFIVICGVIFGFVQGQQGYQEEEQNDPDCVGYDEDINSNGELQRSGRSFLKKKLLFCKGRGGGLFGNHYHQDHHGHYQGHQGHYQYGHYNGPSGYGDYGGYNGGYSSGYGGGYNSRPSYAGNGLYKPGLSYSIGGYNKSPGYGPPPSYPSYGGNSYRPYSSGAYGGSGYSSGYGSGYTSGYGYTPKPNYPTNDYGKNNYNSYSSDSYSSDNYGSKSYEKTKYSTSDYSNIYDNKSSEKGSDKSTYHSLISKLKKDGYTDASYDQEHKDHHHKHHKEDKKTSCESSEESGEDSKSKYHHKDESKLEKDCSKENSSENKKTPSLPVVSQPVYYVPQLPAISVVQPIACGEINPTYAPAPSTCGATSQYSIPTLHNTPIVAPISTPIHISSVIPLSRPAAKYISGATGYQIVAPGQATSSAIAYQPSSINQASSGLSYPPVLPSSVAYEIINPSKQILAPSAAYQSTPVPLSYQPSAMTVPYNFNQAYSLPSRYVAPSGSIPALEPSSSGYQCREGNCGTQQSSPTYLPTYTLTSFDVQTITTPYQPIVASDVTTFAKSGSSVAGANAPSGYVVKSLAIDPPNHPKEQDSSEEQHKEINKGSDKQISYY